jgi:hypothetical protein
MKRPELKSQVLMKTESRVLKSKVQKSLVFQAKWITRPKDFKPRVLIESKPYNFRHNAHNKSKTLQN